MTSKPAIRVRITTVLSLVAAVSAAPAARADGTGVIEGVVKIDGGGAALGKSAPIKITKDESSCGKVTPNETVLVGPEGGLQNVVVYLKDAKAAGPPAPTAN